MTTPYVSTTNACKLCKPLGACLAFRGIEGAVPFLHGSQGCATYMRRYVISHFREPMDIASSSLGEKHAIYGGGPNLKQGLKNVMDKYGARLIGVASTCLTETIGDDMPGLVREFRRELNEAESPEIVTVSTPSYSGTHMEGFHAAVKAVVEQMAQSGEPTGAVNLLPGFVSPADIRYLKEVLADFGLPGSSCRIFPRPWTGAAQLDYDKIPAGGTPLPAIKAMGASRATLEFGRTLFPQETAGASWRNASGCPGAPWACPSASGRRTSSSRCWKTWPGVSPPTSTPRNAAASSTPTWTGTSTSSTSGRWCSAKRTWWWASCPSWPRSALSRCSAPPAGKSGRLAAAVAEVTEGLLPEPPVVREGVDFFEIAEEAEALAPDLLIGHSKGYHLAKRWKVPLVRVGFPIHDRFGGPRILHLGYRGAQNLLDQIVNAMIERKQETSPVGYGYM